MTRTADGPAGPHRAIDTLAWLSQEAFDGDPEQSLLAVVPDVHHAAPMERPEAFNPVLLQFLAEQENPPA